MARARSAAASPVERALAARRRGDRLLSQRGADDELATLNRAAAEYAKALQIFTVEKHPLEFGTVQAALAEVGAREADLGVAGARERAIDAARLATLVFDAQHFSPHHIRLQRLLGGQLRRHAATQPAGAARALRAAADAFGAALATLDKAAPERAELLQELGGAIVAWLYTAGTDASPEPAQALARAIGALVEAGEIQQAHNDSAGLVATFLGLGDAYLLVTGAERKDAQARAAECYRRASTFAYESKDRPSLARAQLNLAGVILDGPHDAPVEALREAADALKLAGRIYTAAAFPAQHAAVQKNLKLARARLEEVKR